MLYGLTMFITETSLQPAELARAAEDRGFDSIWAPEHTHIPSARKTPWPGGPVLPDYYSQTYDPFLALTAMAAVTTRLKLATGICLIVQRDPLTTAKQIATLDRISGGRFIFGIGGGWNREEVEDHGTPFAKRFPILRERILAMKALWTQDEAEFHGQYVNFDKSWAWPKPVQKPHPPIIMGGDGPTTFDRIVEFCDGWLPITRGGGVPADLAGKILDLRHRLQAAGRDPDALTVSLFGAPPNQDVVAAATRSGIDRVIFGVPSAPKDAALKALDEYAKLVK
ncbi:MAG TPA: LLM class F420-dependent oxidoreductase [Dehalococcoidia bacterium]|nr:LLM class F420-dependent oxidoreductase [Dehalococcoidia bacterium]